MMPDPLLVAIRNKIRAATPENSPTRKSLPQAILEVEDP